MRASVRPCESVRVCPCVRVCVCVCARPPTIHLALQGVPLPLQLPLAAGTLQPNVVQVQLVGVLQALHLEEPSPDRREAGRAAWLR